MTLRANDRVVVDGRMVGTVIAVGSMQVLVRPDGDTDAYRFAPARVDRLPAVLQDAAGYDDVRDMRG